MPNPLQGKEALNKKFLIVLIRWLLCLLRASVLVFRVYINDEKRQLVDRLNIIAHRYSNELSKIIVKGYSRFKANFFT